MRFVLALIALSSLYIGTGIFISKINYRNLYKKDKKNLEYYDYSGVLNVHSKKSNGSGSVQEIITAATEAELDFLILNETNPLNQKQPLPIKYGGLNVYYGAELSYKNSRFLYVSLNNNQVFTSFSEIEIFISNLLETTSSELLVLAHPNKPDYEWSKSDQKFSSFEVLNLREVWRLAWERNKAKFLWSLLFYPFNSDIFFLAIYNDEALVTDFWEEKNLKASIVGYVGSDATSKLRLNSKTDLRFPSYKSIFNMARNHVLLKQELFGLEDKERIFQELKQGTSYASIDILGEPVGFAYYGKKGKKSIEMGENIPINEIEKLTVKVPKSKFPMEVILYQNNKVIKKMSEGFEYSPTEVGVYRVEVRVNPRFPIFRAQKWLPWIVSNPIFIGPTS